MPPVPNSLLFIPGHQERMLEKAGSVAADAVVFDLEDSVPLNAKAGARKLVRSTLDRSSSDLPRVFVRLNAPNSGMLVDDAAVVADHPDVGIVITKVDRPAALEPRLTCTI